MKHPVSFRPARPWRTWQAAFSIMEIMVSLGALSVGLGAVMKLTSDQARTITYYESLMEIDSVFEEIRYAMANRKVCDATLANKNVSGAAITEIRLDASTVLFKTSDKYGALKRITLDSITTGTPVGAHGSNEYSLKFSFKVPKAANSNSSFRINRSLNFRATVDGSTIKNCESTTTDQRNTEIWDNEQGSHLLSFLSSSAGSGTGKVGLGMSPPIAPLSLAPGVAGSEHSLDAPGGMLVGVPQAAGDVSNVAYMKALHKVMSTELDNKIENFCANHDYRYIKDGTPVAEAFNAYNTEGIRGCATPIGADWTPAFPATIAPTAQPSCSSLQAGEFVENKNCCHKCGSGCFHEYRFSLYHYYCKGGSSCSSSVPGMYCAGKDMTMTIPSTIPADSFCVHQVNFYEKTKLCFSRSAYCIRNGNTATIICDDLVPTAAPWPTNNICGSLSNGQYVTNTTRCCKSCPGNSCTTETFRNRYGSQFTASYCSNKPGSCSGSVAGNACNNTEVITFSMADNAACKLLCLDPNLHGEGKALCHSRKVTCECDGSTVKLKCSNT